MADEVNNDPFFIQLCQGYTQLEITEIENYLEEWDASRPRKNSNLWSE